MTSSGGPNAEAIEAWNGVLFDKFCRFRPLVTRGLGQHGTYAIGRYLPRNARRVLDVGCGFGDMSHELARHLDAGAEVLGIDGAPRFVEHCEREAAELGSANVRFRCADVQTADLGSGHDAVFSRFGTMFFSNPVQALRTMRDALKPGGLLCMVVWRKREDNEWMHAAELTVRALVPEPENPQGVTCGPGPFSMASADLVSDLLLKAGFEQITFERVDGPICIGQSLDHALEFAMALGPAGELIRLAGAEAERLKPRVEQALRDTFQRFVRADGSVYANSSTWVVSARNQS